MPQDNKFIVGLTKGSFHLIALLPLVWLIFSRYPTAWSRPCQRYPTFYRNSGFTFARYYCTDPTGCEIIAIYRIVSDAKITGVMVFFWAVLHLSSYLLLEIGVNNLALFFEEIFRGSI